MNTTYLPATNCPTFAETTDSTELDAAIAFNLARKAALANGATAAEAAGAAFAAEAAAR